jgi:hypothetical protein
MTKGRIGVTKGRMGMTNDGAGMTEGGDRKEKKWGGTDEEAVGFGQPESFRIGRKRSGAELTKGRARTTKSTAETTKRWD